MSNSALHADPRLLRRFAEWLMAWEPTHAAATLLSAVDHRSPIIGARLKGAIDGVTDGMAMRVKLDQDFTEDEVLAVFALFGAAPDDVTWEPMPTTTRQRRRAAALDTVAQGLGFETWRRFETAVINGDAKIHLD